MESHADWRPTATVGTLRRRAELLAQTRRFFDGRGFFEVQTPLLSRETIVDRYLDPMAVDLELAGRRERFYLQTSPEFGMKRLLAAGANPIYQIGPAFRAGESGSSHNPEFTMLEWYRQGDSYPQGMQLLSDYAQDILRGPPAEIMTYRAAFERYAGVDPFAAREPQLSALLPVDRRSDSGFDRDNLLNWIMAEQVEPNLGRRQPAIVCDWPASQAALAKVREGEPAVAERFELFVGGVELANGYHELSDPEELSRRMDQAQVRRIAAGQAALPRPDRLRDALRAGLPDCCGVAVGFDRLLMVVEKLSSIADVMAFPIDRA